MVKTMAAGSDPKLPPGTNYCRCGACSQYFKSPSAFDMHRVGDGDDRRCLSMAEMVERGMSVNERGYIVTQAWNEQLSFPRDAA